MYGICRKRNVWLARLVHFISFSTRERHAKRKLVWCTLVGLSLHTPLESKCIYCSYSVVVYLGGVGNKPTHTIRGQPNNCLRPSFLENLRRLVAIALDVFWFPPLFHFDQKLGSIFLLEHSIFSLLAPKPDDAMVEILLWVDPLNALRQRICPIQG